MSPACRFNHRPSRRPTPVPIQPPQRPGAVVARWAMSALLALGAAATAHAETTVADAWVRGTVAQQKATGFFARITASGGGQLLSVASPAAGVVEIHEMKMEGTVMRMRALPDGLALPAGQAVELKPGGYHVMLMDLKRALKAGDTVDLTLTVRTRDGQTETVAVKAPVRALGAPAAGEHRH